MRFVRALAIGLVALTLAFPAQAQRAAVHAGQQIEIPGGTGLGPLRGTLVIAGPDAPVVIMIPGSGPTDRDGNNPYGVFGAPFRMLADGLADAGVSTLRIDKRGVAGSRSASKDPNAMSMVQFAVDARAWVDEARRRTGRPCAWVAGHSEGGLVAMALAAKGGEGICGLILIAAPGRKVGPIFRDQFRKGPLPPAMLARGLAALDSLEAGHKVDVDGLDPWLLTVLHPSVQDYMIELLSLDPAAMIHGYSGPVLILQGGRDWQVLEVDARALYAAQPRAKLVMFPDMTHMLKDASDAPGSVAASYRSPTLPLTPGLVPAISGFVLAQR